MICQNGQQPIIGSHYLQRVISLLIFSLLLFTAQTLTAQEKQSYGADEKINLLAPFSLSLNGTDSYLTAPYSTSLNLTGAMTLEMWIKSTDFTPQQTVIARQGSFGLQIVENSAIFTICPTSGRCVNAASAPILAPNQWQHIAAVYDGSQMRVYINGRRSSIGRYLYNISSPSAVTSALKIGASNDGTQIFRGLLDEIRISNAPLYNADFSPTTQLESNANTVGLWKFDGGTFNDSTTNNNHATSGGGATFSLDVPNLTTGDIFRITPTPTFSTSDGLSSVKAIASNDVWAVGSHGPTTCCFPRAAVSLHWDGSQWSSVPVPTQAGLIGADLIAVDATSSTNVWAVGTVGNNSSQRVSLLKWNGVKWNIIALADDPTYPGYGIGVVKSMTVISENDVWVVGSKIGGTSWTLHWDGTSFQTVPSPNLDSGNQLYDIDAISANDIWAVGYAMVIRWNGTAWLPVPGAPRSQFRSVAAIAPNDVWTIAGNTQCPPIGGCVSGVSLLHFDGTQWIWVYPPGVTGQLFLEKISATASDNVWVVGSDNNKVYIAHYDGSVLQRVASENTPTSDSDLDQLAGVSPLNSNEVWTVGATSDFFYNPQDNVSISNNLALRRSVAP